MSSAMERFKTALVAAGRTFEEVKGTPDSLKDGLILEIMGNTTSIADRGSIITAWAASQTAPSDYTEFRQDIRDIKRKLEEVDDHIALSRMSSDHISSILNTIDLDIRVREEDENQNDILPEFQNSHYEAYQWAGHQTAAATGPATDHLRTQLLKFGVRVGDRQEYILHPLPSRKLFRNVHITRFFLSGGCDAVIIPRLLSKVKIAKQLRVIIEYKTTSELDSSDPQCLGELLCGLSVSNHMVLLVKTDLSTRFDFWTPHSGGGYYEEWRCQRGDLAMQHIAIFMRDAHPEPDWREPNMEVRGLSSMKIVKEATQSGIMEEELSILPDLPKEERLPYYIQMMYT